jgi:hypothetical protein
MKGVTVMESMNGCEVELVYPLSYHEYLECAGARPVYVVAEDQPGIRKVRIVTADEEKYAPQVAWVYFPAGPAPLRATPALGIGWSDAEPVFVVGWDEIAAV